MVAGMEPVNAAVPAGPDEPRWQWARLPALSAPALYAALAARQQVFTVEQQCAYLDADGLDHRAWHLLGWDRTAPGTLLAYLRVVDPGAKFAEPSIGRVLTVAARRRSGLGRTLMHTGVAGCATLHPGMPIRISAQQQLQHFYASLGFAVASEPYDEDGIPHVEMLLTAPPEATGRVDSVPALR
jgi:ElaA protein